MKNKRSRNWARAAVTVAGVVTLTVLASTSADARRKRPAPLPPPPPPPPVVVIPYRPIPPNNASPNFQSPVRAADGLYPSVNRKITPAQTVWNLRSGYNVAALNCSKAEYPAMIDNYRAFLRTHARVLTAANRKVDAEFRASYGARFIAPREKYMTAVYNHFALPMTLNDFCKAVHAISAEAFTVPSVQLEAFAARNMPNLEIVFDDFYNRYEQWRIDVAAWDALYAPKPIIAPVLQAGTLTPVLPVGTQPPALQVGTLPAALPAGTQPPVLQVGPLPPVVQAGTLPPQSPLKN